MFKRFSAVLIAAMMLMLAAVPALAFGWSPSEVVSGVCGENLTWTLNTDTGALTVSGTGEMDNYSGYNQPWGSYMSSITSLTVEEGVSSIGKCAFYECSSLRSAVIGAGVTRIGDSCFAYCSSLASVNIPDGVTTMERWVFYSCESLTGIELPDSVTEIGTDAFHSCNALRALRLSENLLSIKRNAFSFCRSLSSVTIPASVTAIGDTAFRCCSTLTSAEFRGEPPTSFGNNVFELCGEGFAIVYDPAFASSWAPNGETEWNGYPLVTVESITGGALGDNLFWNLNAATGVLSITGDGEMAGFDHAPWESFSDSIINVIIGQGVTSISDSAFRGLPVLTALTAPASVVSIGDSAFRDCVKLDSCRAPGVTLIGDHAFRGCSALSSTSFGELTSIGDYAFSGCDSITGFGKDSVTSLGVGVFKDCASLEMITIGDALTVIPDSAFEDCPELRRINFGSGVTRIGTRAFARTALSVVEIPSGVASIASGAFADCPWLTTLVFAGGPPSSVGSGVFAGAYPKLSAVYKPGNASAWSSFGSAWQGCGLVSESMLSYGDSDGGASYVINRSTGVMTVYTDGYDCNISQRPGFVMPWQNQKDNVTEMVFGKGVTGVGQYVFQDFTKLTEVKLHDGFKSISDGAFQGCSRLSSITLPEGLLSLGVSVFRDCTSLTSVVIPDSVTDCGSYAYCGCTSLTSAVVGRGALVGNGIVWLPDGIFKYCTSLTSVTLPDNLEIIGMTAFFGCTSLESITVPKSVRILRQDAFMNCTALKSITLPAALTTIEHSVFKNCTKLTSIIFDGMPPAEVGLEPFADCNSALTLYYYENCVSGWSPNGETTWQGRPIVMIGGAAPGSCDADCNGAVDTTDALIVLRAALGIEGDPQALLTVCDADANGVIDTTDALIILRMSLGIE
ncbi:MAG: leucine-rich repeat protein [Clostridia bacterium]|nr:leucine-rich repeat protein [Clostridia bacterium]